MPVDLAESTVDAHSNTCAFRRRPLMTIARAQLVDVTLTRWYHCITRCVRRAFLLGEGDDNRKEWLEKRLQELAEIFAVALGGFSVIDNHLLLLGCLQPKHKPPDTLLPNDSASPVSFPQSMSNI